MNAIARFPATRSQAARWLAALLLFPITAMAVPALIVDGDGDGVSDERDECPYSRSGETVNAEGCNIGGDVDRDGVSDLADLCPYSIVGARVDAEGCAMDDDFDGIANGLDLCPDTAVGERVDLQGCDPASPGKGRTQLAARPALSRTGAISANAARPIPVAIRQTAAAPTPIPVQRAAPTPVLAVAEVPTVSLPRADVRAAPSESVDPSPSPTLTQPPVLAHQPAESSLASPKPRRLPAAPQIVLTPGDVLALQRHPTTKPSDFAPVPAVAVARVVPQSVEVKTPAVEVPTTPQSSAAPVARRLPSAPQVLLSPAEVRAIEGSAGATRTRAVRLPPRSSAAEPRS